MISKFVSKVPGGSMVVPLFLGALINTFFPQLLDLGGFTTGLARGSDALLGLFLLTVGAGLDFKGAGKSFKIGGVVVATKVLIGIALGLIIAYVFDNNFLGISSLAMIAAATNANAGLYSGIIQDYGNREEMGALPIVSITNGPHFTMIAVGAAGIASVPLTDIIAVLIPVAVGMILAALDENIKGALQTMSPWIIPFFAFALGTGINLGALLEAGLSGILLGFIVTFVIGFFTILADRVTGGTGVAGAAASSTAGNAVGTPSALAAADSSLGAAANLAVPQIAASVIVTAIFTPILTRYIASRTKENSQTQKNVSRENTVKQEKI